MHANKLYLIDVDPQDSVDTYDTPKFKMPENTLGRLLVRSCAPSALYASARGVNSVMATAAAEALPAARKAKMPPTASALWHVSIGRSRLKRC